MLDRHDDSTMQFRRLPAGQHGLAPELVSADQRARLHAAAVQVVNTVGYLNMTVEDLIARASVSRRTFYELYANKQECFLAACDEIVQTWMLEAAKLCDAEVRSDHDTARARLRAGLTAIFTLVLADPLGARTLFLEILNCGSVGLHRLDGAIDGLELAVQDVTDGDFPGGIITVIVGGILEIVTRRLRHGRTDELPGLIDPLVQWFISYKSQAAAAALADSAADSPGAMNGEPDDRRQAVATERSGLSLWRDATARVALGYDQRNRIIEAVTDLVSDLGYGPVSVAAICATAHVSHHTFRRYFSDKRAALIAAYRAGGDETVEYSLKGFAAASTWPSAVHAGLAAELRFLASRPALARIGFLEIYAAGEEALALREDSLSIYAAALEPGYQHKRKSPPHGIVSEAIAGGIYQLMRESLLHHSPEQLPELSPIATYAALAPFLGAKAAAKLATTKPAWPPTAA
jgi:AcrR family transcriptional regulator